MKGKEAKVTERAMKKQLEDFLDCLSRLLAKRWLREQQRDEHIESTEAHKGTVKNGT